MNIKLFGAFILTAGIIAAIFAGYFFRTVHNEEFLRLMREERQLAAATNSYTQYGAYTRIQDAAETKALIFGCIGGLLLLVGVGMRVSAKESVKPD